MNDLEKALLLLVKNQGSLGNKKAVELLGCTAGEFTEADDATAVLDLFLNSEGFPVQFRT